MISRSEKTALRARSSEPCDPGRRVGRTTREPQ
jgi:hypothetical protein